MHAWGMAVERLSSGNLFVPVYVGPQHNFPREQWAHSPFYVYGSSSDSSKFVDSNFLQLF